jgi:hypothetical protein
MFTFTKNIFMNKHKNHAQPTNGQSSIGGGFHIAQQKTMLKISVEQSSFLSLDFPRANQPSFLDPNEYTRSRIVILNND